MGISIPDQPLHSVVRHRRPVRASHGFGSGAGSRSGSRGPVGALVAWRRSVRAARRPRKPKPSSSKSVTWPIFTPTPSPLAKNAAAVEVGTPVTELAIR
jgi:hypothetical protein